MRFRRFLRNIAAAMTLAALVACGSGGVFGSPSAPPIGASPTAAPAAALPPSSGASPAACSGLTISYVPTQGTKIEAVLGDTQMVMAKRGKVGYSLRVTVACAVKGAKFWVLEQNNVRPKHYTVVDGVKGVDTPTFQFTSDLRGNPNGPYPQQLIGSVIVDANEGCHQKLVAGVEDGLTQIPMGCAEAGKFPIYVE